MAWDLIVMMQWYIYSIHCQLRTRHEWVLNRTADDASNSGNLNKLSTSLQKVKIEYSTNHINIPLPSDLIHGVVDE